MDNKRFILISKTIFFPKVGILAVGDLHLGYDHMLREQGIILPIQQLKETERETAEIIEKIGKEKIKKIILLGDIKHFFKYQREEMRDVKNFADFLKNAIKGVKIIFIEGNHDRVQFKEFKYKKYHYEPKIDIIFTHGDAPYDALFSKEVKTIVMSHIHPAVSIKEGVKTEKYKAFLIGRYKSKEIIIVPSFFSLIEGTEINWEYYENGWAFIPKKKLQEFNAFVVGKKNIFEFGKLRGLVKI